MSKEHHEGEYWVEDQWLGSNTAAGCGIPWSECKKNPGTNLTIRLHSGEEYRHTDSTGGQGPSLPCVSSNRERKYVMVSSHITKPVSLSTLVGRHMHGGSTASWVYHMVAVEIRIQGQLEREKVMIM
jgi:hypothetical protein